MRKAILIIIGAVIYLSCLNSQSRVSAQPATTQESTVTLFSVLKHRGEQRKSCVNFLGSRTLSECDLRYGALYAGDDLDWFESSTAQGNRSVIKDLGAHEWNAEFKVPVIEPLAKLKPGEKRQITVDTSGADGADAAGRRTAKLGSTDDVFSRVLPARNDVPVEYATLPPPSVETAPASRPKRDGKTKTSPLFVKAIVGHVYVIHVVDELRDFYALFRVESLQKGDRCTLSWKLIPTPAGK